MIAPVRLAAPYPLPLTVSVPPPPPNLLDKDGKLIDRARIDAEIARTQKILDDNRAKKQQAAVKRKQIEKKQKHARIGAAVGIATAIGGSICYGTAPGLPAGVLLAGGLATALISTIRMTTLALNDSADRLHGLHTILQDMNAELQLIDLQEKARRLAEYEALKVKAMAAAIERQSKTAESLRKMAHGPENPPQVVHEPQAVVVDGVRLQKKHAPR